MRHMPGSTGSTTKEPSQRMYTQQVFPGVIFVVVTDQSKHDKNQLITDGVILPVQLNRYMYFFLSVSLKVTIRENIALITTVIFLAI